MSNNLFDFSINLRISEIVQTLMHRTEAYIKSIEFTRCIKKKTFHQFISPTCFTLDLGVPPDFHIEHAILNMHIWLMTNRLNQINVSFLLQLGLMSNIFLSIDKRSEADGKNSRE